MSLVLNDRVQETASAPGTGAVSLLGAVTGYQTFSAGVGNGNTCYYCIADQGGSNWEVGIGTYSSSGNTLARTTPLSGSSATPVSFSSGTQVVFVTYPAEKSVNQDASGNVGIGGASTGSKLYVTGVIESTTGGFKFPDGTTQTTAAYLADYSATPPVSPATNSGWIDSDVAVEYMYINDGTGTEWVNTTGGVSNIAISTIDGGSASTTAWEPLAINCGKAT